MSNIYYATTFNDNQVYIPGIIGAFARPFSFNINSTVSAAGFVVNDTVALCNIPWKSGAGGCMLLDYKVNLPPLDSATAIRLSLGDNNGSAGAFQATYYSTVELGYSSNSSVMGSQLATTAGVTTSVVLPVMTQTATTAAAASSVMPRSYTATTVTSSSTPYIDLAFILKITTAGTTATTVGLITGYCLFQPLGTQSVTYLNGSTT